MKSNLKPLKPENRVYYTWDKWECYPAGFYEVSHPELEDDECRERYKNFLSDLAMFERGLKKVLAKWKRSTEHYLTNLRMNRIAWLGQAAACIQIGIPSRYRSGYFDLTEKQQGDADKLALKYLNKWLNKNGFESVDMSGAGVSARVNLY